MKKLLAILALAFALPSAFADTATTGLLAYTEISASTFVVKYDTPQTMCAGSSQVFAYLNTTDANYSVYVATLETAKAIGWTVTIYTANVGGNCHITWMSVA